MAVGGTPRSLVCFLSEEARFQRTINQKIEQELRKEKRLARKNLKLLLLGTGESGKSTFLRQMRIIHDRGFESAVERCEYITRIQQNILVTMITVDHAMTFWNIRYGDPTIPDRLWCLVDARCNAEQIRFWRRWFTTECIGNGIQSLHSYQSIVQVVERLQPDDLSVIKEFWHDPNVQLCLVRRNQYNLMDSSGYFMERAEEIVAESYVPTVQDILRVRIPTNGINEYQFVLESVNFMIVDVGGQRTERRKWIHCFENVTSIIFIASLSEYDQIMVEPLRDHFAAAVTAATTGGCEINKLEESKALFRMIITSQWFRNSSVVLFLNKYDLFEEKITAGPNRLGDFWPEYGGDERDPRAGADFILALFYRQLPERDRFRKRSLYAHFTCATDTRNIQIVFQAIKDTIMEQMLCKEIQIF